MNKKKGSSKNLIKEISFAHGITLANFKAINNSSLQDLLVKFEKASLFKKYKFGVLLINDGQTKDDEFFSNRSSFFFSLSLFYIFIFIFFFNYYYYYYYYYY